MAIDEARQARLDAEEIDGAGGGTAACDDHGAALLYWEAATGRHRSGPLLAEDSLLRGREQDQHEIVLILSAAGIVPLAASTPITVSGTDLTSTVAPIGSSTLPNRLSTTALAEDADHRAVMFVLFGRETRGLKPTAQLRIGASR